MALIPSFPTKNQVEVYGRAAKPSRRLEWMKDVVMTSALDLVREFRGFRVWGLEFFWQTMILLYDIMLLAL